MGALQRKQTSRSLDITSCLAFKSRCFNIKNLCILSSQCIHMSYDSRNKHGFWKILYSYSSINHESSLSWFYILSAGKQLLTICKSIALLRSFDPENKGATLLRNTSNYLIKTRHNNIPEDINLLLTVTLPYLTPTVLPYFNLYYHTQLLASKYSSYIQ
jgi:hypothetical protein